MKNELSNIMFVHMSKTAGRALVFSIKQNYLEKNILEVYVLPKSKTSIYASKLNNETIIEALKQQYTTDRLDNIKFFAGHISYGIHSMFKQKFDYITMMRDPVDRIVSHYYFNLRMDPTVKEKYTDLEDYVENRKSLHNWMTKRLSNANLKQGGDLDLAKKNIVENFALCGITEKYEETLALLTKMYNLKLSNMVVNKTKNRLPISSINSNIINKIKTLHYKDVELYEFAREIFSNKLKNI
jgi:hypothetical protein